MDEGMPFLSIIVPVYNVKNYITECVRSFTEAEYKNLEIILIDDGSTDGSSIVCDKLSEHYHRVKVYHIKNGGASAARNFGIEKAKGDYVFFCDSDDFVDKTEFTTAMEAICKSKADLYVLTACHESDKTDSYFVDDVGLKKGYTEDLSKIYEYTLKIRLSAPWKKFFKRKVIEQNNLRFPVGRILHEDLSFFLDYLHYAQNAEVLGQVMYYHRYSPNSLSRKTDFTQFDDLINVYSKIKDLASIKKIPHELLPQSQDRLLAILMGIIARMKKVGISNREITDRLNKCDMDCLVKDFSPTGLKSFIRIVFYRTRLFNIYALMYR